MTNCCNFDLDPGADPDFRGHSILTLASMAKTCIFPMAQECCHFRLKSHLQLKANTITHCWVGNDADPGCDPDFVRMERSRNFFNMFNMTFRAYKYSWDLVQDNLRGQ